MNCEYVRYCIRIKYWVKIVHGDDNKYVKKGYNMFKYGFESHPDKKNWCSLLYGLLCTLGFNDAWLFQDIGDSVLFLSLVIKRSVYTKLKWKTGRIKWSYFLQHISSFDFKPYYLLFKCIFTQTKF